MKKDVAVIGAGIIGITTAITLLENGFNVTIFTKDQPLRTNSDAAIASWHAPNDRKRKLQQLCLDSLPKFNELSKLTGSGVSYTDVVLYYQNKEAFRQNSWIKYVSPTSELPAGIIKKADYPYMVMVNVPLMDANIYRPFLLDTFYSLKGKLKIKKVTLDELALKSDIVINCAGWEAMHLVNDPRIYPIRGQIIITNAPTDLKKHISIGVSNIDAYVVFRPQSNDCVLGTTYQKNDLRANILKSDTDAILAKVSDFFPQAKNLKIKTQKVGFRCGRSDVQLKTEYIVNSKGKKALLIHCYGHGGSGYSASWGSAYKILDHCSSI